MVHKLAHCIVNMACKLAQAKNKHPALILEVSTSNVGDFYVSHLFPGLTALISEPARALCCLEKHS